MDLRDNPFSVDDFLGLYPLPTTTTGAGSGPAPAVAATTAPVLSAPELDERTRRMIDTSVSVFTFTVLVGPPGTGKGTILTDVVNRVAADPTAFGFDAHPSSGWPSPIARTPDESTTVTDLVGGLAPDGKGGLAWTVGPVLDAIVNDRWLRLDELNRAELDKILGPLFTWLAGERVEIGRTTSVAGSPRIVLDWDHANPHSHVTPAEGLATAVGSVEEVVFTAGRDFRILGTYNPTDAHLVFAMGSALTRRLRQVPIPPVGETEFVELMNGRYPDLPPDLVDIVAGLYRAHLADPDLALGAAVFLDIPAYVIRLLPEDPDDIDDTDAADAIAEAYLLTAGKFIADYSEPMTERLRAAMSADATAATIDLEWVLTAASTLNR